MVDMADSAGVVNLTGGGVPLRHKHRTAQATKWVRSMSSIFLYGEEVEDT